MADIDAGFHARRPTPCGDDRLDELLMNGREQVRQQADAEKEEIYKQIGQLKVELDFLKKKSWPHRLKSNAPGSILLIGT